MQIVRIDVSYQSSNARSGRFTGHVPVRGVDRTIGFFCNLPFPDTLDNPDAQETALVANALRKLKRLPAYLLGQTEITADDRFLSKGLLHILE
ncbi:MAG: hypothetical protein AAFR45_03840 [Pseudomonadota bacterium]